MKKDWVGDNTSRGQKAAGKSWLAKVALFVLGFVLFTMMLWSV